MVLQCGAECLAEGLAGGDQVVSQCGAECLAEGLAGGDQR